MPKYFYNLPGYMRAKNIVKNNRKRLLNKLHSDIEKIRIRTDTVVITYKDIPAPFDYVDDLFPSAKVKNAVIYKCNTKFLRGLGYVGMDGLFVPSVGAIVIPKEFTYESDEDENDIVLKATADEVIVHELLHYASDTYSRKFNSFELEEEFAYGNSVKYLRSKGHSDEDIVNNNFMPYLIKVIDKKEISKQVLIKHGHEISDFVKLGTKEQYEIFDGVKDDIISAIKERTFDMGMRLIAMYSGDKKQFTGDVDNNKFSNIDL